MQKKIIVLGAGIYQYSLIELAKRNNLRVISVDNIKNNPGHKIADQSYNISITDKEKCLELAKSLKIDAVITAASDVAIPTLAYIGEALGLNSINYQAAITLSNKGLFRCFLHNNNFSHPPFIVSENYKEIENFFLCSGYKCILKPVDSSGSKGVFVIESRTELAKNFQNSLKISRAKKLCMEKFIDGKEIGGDALVVNGKVKFLMITNKYLTKPPYYVPLGHIVPGNMYFNEKVKFNIIKTLQKIVDILKINNSSINFDIIIDKNDNIYPIDIGARTGGNCIPEIIKLSTGVDLLKANLDISLGKLPDLKLAKAFRYVGSRILTSKKSGIIKYIKDINDIKKQYDNLVEIKYDYNIGDCVNSFTQGNYRIGNIILHDNSIDLLEKQLNEIEKNINLIVG